MSANTKRARDLGIPFDGIPIKDGNNAITDVKGVGVGQKNTNDLGLNIPTVNTGVTAILPVPNNKQADDSVNGIANGINTTVWAAWHSINGCGEMTGTHWIEESGQLNGPILLTNTASIGTVRDAVIQYSKNLQNKASLDIDTVLFGPLLPLVAETYDGWLSDILSDQMNYATYLKLVTEALDDATDPQIGVVVAEGSVGAGTGTTCYDWKGGIGTASRQVELYQVSIIPTPTTLPPWTTNHNSTTTQTGIYRLGVLVQANQGTYWDLVIRGVPVGAYLTPPLPAADPIPQTLTPPASSNARTTPPTRVKDARKSSIIVVVATDAPLLPDQLKRLAKRATHGIARTGTNTDDDSGELVIAFSTANQGADNLDDDEVVSLQAIPNDNLDPFFAAVAQATEEAIINALVMAAPLKVSFPLDSNPHLAQSIMDPSVVPSLLDVLKSYNLMNPPPLPTS